MKLLEYEFNEEDIITTDKYLELEDDLIGYVKTDFFYLNKLFMWRNKLHPKLSNFATKKIIITGHSDFPITDKIIEKHVHRFNKWFTINNFTQNPKIISIPLGITNNSGESELHNIYGNTKIMLLPHKEVKNFINLVYMNFNINNYPQERQLVYNMFNDKIWVTKGTQINTLEGRLHFLKELYNHKFVLCPRGNGLDTHRLWETLYMKSIPIVKYHDNFKDMKDLPILFIEEWNEITEDYLNKKYEEMINKDWNMDKIKFNYWKNLIK